MGQRKVFNFSCVRKETIDINILVTSRNGDRKVVQFMHNE